MPRFRNNFILRELPRNSQATQIELKREYQLNNMSFDSIPKELRGLRACLVCSMVKTIDQFERDGCDNCERFLHIKNDREFVMTCTSSNFDGIISMINPEDSWVAKWQRIDKLKPGCYAVSVSGQLPHHVIRDLKMKGIQYRSRDLSSRS